MAASVLTWKGGREREKNQTYIWTWNINSLLHLKNREKYSKGPRLLPAKVLEQPKFEIQRKKPLETKKRIEHTWFNSSSYFAISVGSTTTSGGARAGAATNSSCWLLFFYDSTNHRIREFKISLPNKFPCEPQEGLFKVIVWFSRNLIILKIFFAMEGDLDGLHLTFLIAQEKVHIKPKKKSDKLWIKSLTLTSTLLPHNTIGMFSQTLSRSRCQFGTFL